MTTILLLAGLSKRFWPLAHKPFAVIGGKTLLGHQLDRLSAAGCDPVTLVGGAHNLEMVAALAPGLATVEQEDLALGMQGAMLSALPKVDLGKPVLVVSSNDVVETSAYKRLREAASAPGVDGAILAKRVERYFPGGYLTVEGDRATGIVEKPAPGTEPSDLVTIVAHMHNDPAAFHDALKNASSERDDGYEVALAELLRSKRYVVVPYEGVWQPVKYPWHLLSLLPHLLGGLERRIHPTAQVHPSAVVEGPVVLEEGVRIMPHATVVGPAYIGKGTMIGNGSLVTGSSVGEHCVVGFGTEVKASILADHVWTHTTYIGDSVIGCNVSFGAGCVTGNLRLDEGEIESVVGEARVGTSLRKFGTVVGEHCRIGIRVGINPGVKIGGGTMIAGGVTLAADVPSNSFVRPMATSGVEIRPNKSPIPHRAGSEWQRKLSTSPVDTRTEG